MNDADFFPARPDVEPMIYAYEEKNPRYAGMLKVGFASAGVERRVAEQFPDSIQRIAKQGELDEFSLNEFFAAKGRGGEAAETVYAATKQMRKIWREWIWNASEDLCRVVQLQWNGIVVTEEKPEQEA